MIVLGITVIGNEEIKKRTGWRERESIHLPKGCKKSCLDMSWVCRAWARESGEGRVGAQVHPGSHGKMEEVPVICAPQRNAPMF